MILRCLTTLSVAGALAIGPAGEARADAGDFIGGAIVGGVIGHAITKNQMNKKQTTTKRVYRPGIPATSQGAQTQTALNYFGYNAGRVDGQVGAGTRRAIEAYQATMGYPVNGRNFPPYQYDFLMSAYYWAQNGGQAQTQLAGQPLLMAYRQQMQTGTVYAGAPVPQAQGTTNVIVAASAPTAPDDQGQASTADATSGNQLPNLFAGGTAAASLANKCNAVLLQTSTNGGYTTLASMSDADFALSEQFCLARSYAISRGEELMQQVQGLTPQQIAEQCMSYGDMVKAQVDAISLSPQAEAEATMRSFALGTGIPPADLAATSRVCLSVGYAQDNMQLALGSALMLVTLGEPAYGELLGHHLREGFGTTQRRDLAMQWYQASLTAIENGAEPIFMPSQTERPMLIREATVRLQTGEQQGVVTTPQGGATTAALPTFKVGE